MTDVLLPGWTLSTWREFLSALIADVVEHFFRALLGWEKVYG